MLVDDLVLHPHTAMAWNHAPRLYRESALRETASSSPDPYLPATSSDSPLVSLPSSQDGSSSLYAPIAADSPFLGRSPATPFATLFASSPAGFWRGADYSVSPVVRQPDPMHTHDPDAHREWYVCKCLIDLGHAPKASPGITRLLRVHNPAPSSLSSLSSVPSSPSDASSHIPTYPQTEPELPRAASSRARTQAPTRSRLRNVAAAHTPESDSDEQSDDEPPRTRARARTALRPSTRAAAARHAAHMCAAPKPRPRAAQLRSNVQSDETPSEGEEERAYDTRSRKRRAPEPAPPPRAKRTRTSSASAGEDDRRKGKSRAQSQPAQSPATPAVYENRTFPADMSRDEQFPLFYRRFHVSSFPRADRSNVPGLSDASYNPPADPLNLYTPRFVKGKGTSKVGLCPCCFEGPTRGGEGMKLWLSMKFSAFNYHMQFSHGISAMTGRPFSPPVAFRTIARAEVGKHEKARIMQGRCHRCHEWVAVEGIKNVPVKVKEIFWWKHAASCHQGSTIDGESDIYVEDDIYRARVAEAAADDDADAVGSPAPEAEEDDPDAEGEDEDADAEIAVEDA